MNICHINPGNALVLVGILLLLTTLAEAQSVEDLTRWAMDAFEYRVNTVVRLILCSIWYITAGVLSLVIVIAGIEYMTSDNLDSRNKAKKRVAYGVIALIMVLIACPLVNYVVHGSEVNEFRCDCIPEPPPTTTSTTTTLTPYTIVTITTTSTTTTTTSTTSTTTTILKTRGGKFFMVGVPRYTTIPLIRWILFNMDGSIYKGGYGHTGSGDLICVDGVIAMSVGQDRFFIAYDSRAMVLDWEGDVVKSNFTTKNSYLATKTIQIGNKFHLLLSPEEGEGCIMQVYDLNGSLEFSYKVDTTKIAYFTAYCNNPLGVDMQPEVDMTYGGGKIFIVWHEPSPRTSECNASLLNAPFNRCLNVKGIIYDLNGNKIRDEFTIYKGFNGVPKEINYPVLTLPCTGFYRDECYYYYTIANPQIASGGKYFMVMFNGRIYLYDINTLDLIDEKSTPIPCTHDLIYADGRFFSAGIRGWEILNINVTFYSEEGDILLNKALGGSSHADQPTSLAYGNNMFVVVSAMHYPESIGVSFLDYTGDHIRDVRAMPYPESQGWIAYDW